MNRQILSLSDDNTFITQAIIEYVRTKSRLDGHKV